MMLRTHTRVAVIQLAYHPATLIQRRSPLEDPLFDAAAPDSLVPPSNEIPDSLKPKLASLRRRIRENYGAQLLARAQAILAACKSLGVRIAVFPEHSIPWEILGGLADGTQDILIIAGSHTVELNSLRTGYYEYLGLPRERVPPVGISAAPILFGGRLLDLVPKLVVSAQKPNENAWQYAQRNAPLRPPMAWAPTSLPEGLPGPLAVLTLDDFLAREQPPISTVLDTELPAARFMALIGSSPTSTLPEILAENTRTEARRYGRPILYANRASMGGTTLFATETRIGDLRRFPDSAGYLEPGDEGCVVADIDLSFERGPKSNAWLMVGEPLRPVAEATLVYRSNPIGDAYARFLDDIHHLIDKNQRIAIPEIVARIEDAKNILLNAGALPGAEARNRRLKRLLTELDKITELDEIRQFLREIALPPAVLPLPVLRAALARAAADTLFEWLKDPEAKAAGYGEIEARLRQHADALLSDPSSFTRGAQESIAHLRMSARAAEPEREARAPESVAAMRVVLPRTLDPAWIGKKRCGDFSFDFRARPDDFQNELRALQSTDGTRFEGRVRVISDAEAQLIDLSEAHFWAAEELYLLALAESADHAAAVTIRPEKPATAPADDSPDGFSSNTTVLAILSASAEGWILREAGNNLWLADRWPEVAAAFAEAGIHPIELENIRRGEYDKRIEQLLHRFSGARQTIFDLRRQKLREVMGHFVGPDVFVGDRPPRVPMLKALDRWLESRDQCALVLGEFGSGKSTSLAQWSSILWECGTTDTLPILINLAVAPRALDPEGLMLGASHLEDNRKNRAALRLLLRHQRLLPIFDGFDEMATRLESSDLAGRLSALLDVVRSGGKIVISSRDHYFPPENELRTAAENALAQTLRTMQGLRRLVLQPFDDDQVRQLIEQIRGEAHAAQEALNKISKTYDLRDLVSRPLLLGMVLATLDQIEPGSKVGTADLYEAYLARWLDQTRSGDPDCFTDSQKIEFAEAMADELWRSGRPSAAWPQVQQSVRARLGKFLPGEMPSPSAFLEIQRGAFFVRESEERYRFAHKSFLEYFVARAMVSTLPERPQAVLHTRPITREIAAFVGEILRRKGAVKEASAVKAVQAWLTGGMVDRWTDDARDLLRERGEVLSKTTTSAANAVRLLLALGRWAGDPGGWVPEGADLRAIRLMGADLSGASLVGALLENAELSGADLSHADLRGAKLDGAKLSGAKLFGTLMTGAGAVGADFSQAEADRADLSGVDFSIAALNQSVWTGCTWEGTRLDGADVTAFTADPRFSAVHPSIPRIDITKNPIVLAGATLSHQPDSRVRPSLQWHPNGRKLLCSGLHGTTFVFDTHTGRPLSRLGIQDASARFHQSGRSIVSVSFLPNGRFDNTVVVYRWDAETFEKLSERTLIRNHPAWSVRLVDDRHFAAISSKNTTNIIDLDTDRTVTIQRNLGFSHHFAVDPDGKMAALASAEETSVQLWNLRTGLSHKLPLSAKEIAELSFHPARLWLAIATTEGRVFIYNCETGKTLYEFSVFGRVSDMQWHPDGYRLAVVSAGTVYLGDTRDESFDTRELRFADIRTPKITKISWSPEGSRIAVTTKEGLLEIWSIDTREKLLTLDHGLSRGFQSAVFRHADNSIAVADFDGGIRIFSVETGREERRVAPGKAGDAQDSIVFHKHLNEYLHLRAGSLAVCELWTGERLHQLDASGATPLHSAAFNPEGTRIAAVGLDALHVWDAGSQAEVRKIALPPIVSAGGKITFDWHPTESVVAVHLYYLIGVWNADTGELLHQFTAMQPYPSHAPVIAWHPDGRTVAYTSLSGIELRHLQDQHHQHLSLPNKEPITALAFSPSGNALSAANAQGTIMIWQLKHSRVGATLNLPSREPAVALNYSPDGSLLLCATYRALYWFDIPSRRLLCTFEASGVNSLARTPGGYCVIGDGNPNAYRFGLRRPETDSETLLFLPLSGLREFLHRPEKVAAALAGDLSGDDASIDLQERGFGGGIPWDGKAQQVNVIPLSQAPKAKGAQRSAVQKPMAPSLEAPRADSDKKVLTHDEAHVEEAVGATLDELDTTLRLAEEQAAEAYESPNSDDEDPWHAAAVAARSGGTTLLSPPSSGREATPPSPRAAGRAGSSLPPVVHAPPPAILPMPLAQSSIETPSKETAKPKNPFRPGPALTDVDTLPGREGILLELLALVESRSPAVLRGPRRSGKTSIFYTLEKRLQAAGYPVRRITLEGTHIITKDHLARAIDLSLKNVADPADALLSLLRDEKNAVLLIDEIANLSTADPRSVFAYLRLIGQEYAGIVFAGSHWDWVRVIERAALAPGSSFGNDVSPVDLGPIPEHDAIRFLVDNAPPDTPMEESRTARWIVERTGPWPFYLQVMGHAVVQAVRSGNRLSLVESRGVSDLYEQRLLLDRDAVFRTRFAELPGRARRLLRDALHASTPSSNTNPMGLPPYTEFSREDKKILRDTGLCNPVGQWLDDRPFYEWIRRSADDHDGDTDEWQR